MDQDNTTPDPAVAADFHICVFPNLNEFMTLDLRDQQAPAINVFDAQELLTPEYFRHLEEGFSTLLRSEDEPPFAKLIALPARVQTLLQEYGMMRLAKLIAGEDYAGVNGQIAFFIVSGPVLSIDEEELDSAVLSFFDSRFPARFIDDCRETFKRLLEKERVVVQEQERDALRRAVLGNSDQFYTLWQDRRGGGGRGFSTS